jgi:hypothetical protein
LRTDDQLQDGWLFELHSKIWDRKFLPQDLFYEVEITAAHYVELRNRLENLYTNRNSKDYRNNNVLSIKLNVLQSFTPPPELLIQVAHPGNDEDKLDIYGMSDDELCAFFPAKNTYMSLSNLKLKKPSARIPLPLLIRQEYCIIPDLLNTLPERNAGSMVISGQPGTGETPLLSFFPFLESDQVRGCYKARLLTYLYSQITRSMIEGVPFLYQTIQGHVYHVADSITLIKSWWPEELIVALVDADTASYAPKDFLNHELIQIVLTSSPKGLKQPWMSQYANWWERI